MDPQEHTEPKRRRRLRLEWPRSPSRSFGRATVGRRRTLWIVSAVVVVPLALLLSLQYWLLRNLERSAAVAHSAALQAQLELLTKHVVLHFATLGERALRIPPWIFEQTVDATDRLVFRHLSPARPRPGDPAAG